MRCVLITGANRGLGLETARQLARGGHRVVLAGRRRRELEAEAARLRAAGHLATVLELDVADPGSISAAQGALAATGVPELHVLVNNAAIALEGFDAEVARRTLEVNLRGPLRVTEALRPLLRPGAQVVMVSSGLGDLGVVGPEVRARLTNPGLDVPGLLSLVDSFVAAVAEGRHEALGWPPSAYSVSKVALNALVRIWAPGFAAAGVRVNAVCPGWVRTAMGGPSAPRSVEEGAASIVAAASAREGPSGAWFRDGLQLPW